VWAAVAGTPYRGRFAPCRFRIALSSRAHDRGIEKLGITATSDVRALPGFPPVRHERKSAIVSL
jgi:hypothetical protein